MKYKLFTLTQTDDLPFEMDGQENPPEYIVFHHDDGDTHYTRIGIDTEVEIAYYIKGGWKLEKK